MTLRHHINSGYDVC